MLLSRYQDRHDISYIRALGLLLLFAASHSKCIAILGQEVGEVLPWGGIAAQLLPSAGLPQFAQFTQSSKFREAGLVCPGRICILGNIRFLEYQYCLPDLPVSIVTMADIWGFQSSAVQCWMLNVSIYINVNRHVRVNIRINVNIDISINMIMNMNISIRIQFVLIQ